MSTTSDVQETKMFQQSNSQSEELLKRNITKPLCAKQTGTQIKELLYNISITTTLSETCNKQFEEDAKEILKLLDLFLKIHNLLFLIVVMKLLNIKILNLIILIIIYHHIMIMMVGLYNIIGV